MPNFSLKGKRALVTGASRGIGQAMAVALAEAGADVICASSREGGCEETINIIKTKTDVMVAELHADLSDLAAVEKLADDALSVWRGRLSIGAMAARFAGKHRFSILAQSENRQAND